MRTRASLVASSLGLFSAFAYLLGGGCHGGAPSEAGPQAAPQGDRARQIAFVATAEIRGTPEPCGCQSDPLGDVARIATILAEARQKGPALLVDAGGLRYAAEPVSVEKEPQAELKAQLLESTWQTLDAVVGVGFEDFTYGEERVPIERRLCSNAIDRPRPAGDGEHRHSTPRRTFHPPFVRDVGGIKVGFFGVMDGAPFYLPRATAAVGPSMVAVPQLDKPVDGAKRAVEDLKKQGAELVVALANVTRADAKQLVRRVPGIALVVVGEEVGEEGGAPEQVGDTILVQPADQGQKVARVTFVLDGVGKWSTKLYGGAEGQQAEVKRDEKRLGELAVELERLAKVPDADKSYVAARQKERDDLALDVKRLRAEKPTPPPPPYAEAQLVPVSRRVARDPLVAEKMKALDKRVGEANRLVGEKTPVPPPDPGEPKYVGIETCSECHQHEAATDFWKTTVHAKAWQELVAVDKQWSFDCIGCHTTGFGKRGGSAMGHVDGLTDVQCEVCHGAGSLHAAKPKQVAVPVPSPTESTCKQCHTPEHSDTFQYEAYLRDVLGPAHGAKRRAALGPGPTGHELRQAAIAKAKAEGMR